MWFRLHIFFLFLWFCFCFYFPSQSRHIKEHNTITLRGPSLFHVFLWKQTNVNNKQLADAAVVVLFVVVFCVVLLLLLLFSFTVLDIGMVLAFRTSLTMNMKSWVLNLKNNCFILVNTYVRTFVYFIGPFMYFICIVN